MKREEKDTKISLETSFRIKKKWNLGFFKLKKNDRNSF